MLSKTNKIFKKFGVLLKYTCFYSEYYYNELNEVLEYLFKIIFKSVLTQIFWFFTDE